MEYAHGAGDFNCTWYYWRCGCLRTFLLGRACLSSRPCACTDHDVFKTVRSRALNDIPYPNTGTFLVHSPGKDFMDSCPRNTNHSNIYSSIWDIYDATGLGMGRLRAVSYTHLRAHETGRNLVCRLLLEK